MPPLELIQGLVSLGIGGVALAGLWLFINGTVRVGKLVDAAAKSVQETFDKVLAELKEAYKEALTNLQGQFDKREAVRDKREQELIKERDEWKERYYEESKIFHQMADRLELAYGILTGTIAAPGKGKTKEVPVEEA